MPRILQALLLTPDRSAVVLDHNAVRASLAAALAFGETYPDAPTLAASLHGVRAEEWAPGRVLRLVYQDDGSGPTIEAWRVRRRRRSHTSRTPATAELTPLWMDLADRTLVAEIEGTSVATPRMALVSRSPASCLGVAFDPLNGAPSTASGGPMFIVGSVEARYENERVDVSVMGGTPLDVVEAVCADLRCLWRARLVLSGDGPADEVYEVSLYAPAEPPTVPAQAFESAAAEKLSLDGLAEIGNAWGTLPRPNAADLTVEDDVAGLVTALVPLAASDGEDAVGIAGHIFSLHEVDPAASGTRTVRLRGRNREVVPVVPFDGALDGLLLARLDDAANPAWTIVASAAPDSVTVDVSVLPLAGAQLYGRYRFMRGTAAAGAPRRALVELVNGPAAAVYGVRSEARTYDDIAPYDNLFSNGACDVEGTDLNGVLLPESFNPSLPLPQFEWTDAEASVSLGARSAQFTADAGSGVYATTGEPPGAGSLRARAVWVSMRVLSGRVEVSARANAQPVPGMTPASIVVSAAGGTPGDGGQVVGADVLTTVEIVAADVGPAPVSFDVTFSALDAGTVWVVDGLTVVAATSAQPYRTLMGPNALWTRAWDDLIQAQRRVTTASTTAFDPEALGIEGHDLSPGAWVRVRPEGRAPFEAQVLEARWEQDLGHEGEPGGLAVERQMRLGPPPYDLVSRLSSPAARARAPEGAKRAPVYPYLIDRGATPSGRGRRIEPSEEGIVTQLAVERTFLGVTYALTAYRPTARATQLVRRDPSRPDDRALRLTQPPA